MQPRYVRTNRHEWSMRNGGCEACGNFGALSGTVHNVRTCRACGTAQCEGLREECSVCLYGLTGRTRMCGYTDCERPAVSTAPRVRFVCAEHLTAPKFKAGGQVSTLADRIAEAAVRREKEWELVGDGT